MSARVLKLISALSNVIGKGGTVLSSVDMLAPGQPDVIETTTLEGDEDAVTFTLPATHSIVPYLTARRPVAIVMDDGSGGTDTTEWRVSAASRRRSGVPRGQVAVTLAPLVRDLVDCGWCYDPTLPAPVYTGSMQGTKADFWNAIVAPLLARVGYDYIVLGIDSFPTQSYTWSWDKATPWAVLRAVLSSAPTGACELRLRRDPATGTHYLDTVAEINAGVTVTVGINNALREASTSYDVTQMATRLSVSGAGDTTVDQHVFRVVTTSGSAVQLDDPEGAVPLLASSGQYVGRYLRRLSSGRCFPITDTTPLATGSLTGVFTVTGLPAAGLTAGERCEVVESVPSDAVWDRARRLALPARVNYGGPPLPNAAYSRGLGWMLGPPTGTSGREVAVILDTTTVHPLISGSFDASLDDPADVVDLRCEVWRPLAATTNYARDRDTSDNVAEFYAVVTLGASAPYSYKIQHFVWTLDGFGGAGGTTPIYSYHASDVALPAGAAVGDILACIDHTGATFCMELTALDGARIVFSAVHPVGGNEVPASAASWTTNGDLVSARAYRRQNAYPRVEARAGTNTLELDSAAGVQAGDHIMFVRNPEPTRYVGEVVDGVAESSFGARAQTISSDTVEGVRNLTQNGTLTRWTSGLPTGFAATAGAAPVRDTTFAPAQVGSRPDTLRFDATGTVASVTRRHWWRSYQTQAAAKLWYYVQQGATAGQASSLTLALYDMTRRLDGSTRTLIGTYTIPADKVVYDAPATAALEGVTVPAGCRDVVVEVAVTVGFQHRVYVAALCCVPRGTAPAQPIDETGCNALIGLAAATLATRSNPATQASTFSFDVRDVEREHPELYGARKLDVGITVLFTEPDSGVASLAVRVRKLVRYLNRPDRATLEAAKRLPTVSALLASGGTGGSASLSAGGMVVQFVNGSGSDAAVAVTLAQGRTITTLAEYLAHNATFNVRDYGAVGDGVTNDLPALQYLASVVNASGLLRARVVFPPGIYYCNTAPDVGAYATFTIPVVVEGHGAELRSNNSADPENVGGGCYLTGLSFASTAVLDGLRFRGALCLLTGSYLAARGVTWTNMHNSAVSCGTQAIDALLFDDCVFDTALATNAGNYECVSRGAATTDPKAKLVVLRNCRARGVSGVVDVHNAGTVAVIGGRYEGVDVNAVKTFNGCDRLLLDGVTADGAPLNPASANRHLRGDTVTTPWAAGGSFAFLFMGSAPTVLEVRGGSYTNFPKHVLYPADATAPDATTTIGGGTRFQDCAWALGSPLASSLGGTLYVGPGTQFVRAHALVTQLSSFTRRATLDGVHLIDSHVDVGDAGYQSGAEVVVRDCFASYDRTVTGNDLGPFRTTATGASAGYLVERVTFAGNTIVLSGGATVAIGGALTTALLDGNRLPAGGTMVGTNARVGVVEPSTTGTYTLTPTETQRTIHNAHASANITYVVQDRPADRIPVGTRIPVAQMHATRLLAFIVQVSDTPTYGTINGVGTAQTAAQYATGTLLKIADGVWVIESKAGAWSLF